MSSPVETFSRHRELLIGVAYRVLGSANDAEDVVQEAWLRWSTVDTTGIVEPRAFLITTVTRLAIDKLRQARSRREAYPGTWLPEPVSHLVDAADRAELADSVDLALLVVLETLSPLERAVFVLREAFELPFAEIAEAIGREESAARQLARRARDHVQERRPRFSVDRVQRREITERFLAASNAGDLDALTSLLARDVTLVSDSGGQAKSPLRTIDGADKVARFLHAISTDQGAMSFMASLGVAEVQRFDYVIAEINAAPAIVVYADGRPVVVVSLVVVDGLVGEIYLMVNPAKLVHVTPG